MSNACQSWHLWGMSLDFVVNWLKKKAINTKKYRPILGYSYFIRKGAFYLERRRESRGWAISSIFFSCSYLQKFFFFSRQLYTYIHSLLSQPTLHKFRVIDLSTSSNSCCIIFYNIIGDELLLKVTRPSFFGGLPSYFEALCYPHLYFYRTSNT